MFVNSISAPFSSGARLTLVALGLLAFTTVGCARKEKVLDVKAPGFELQVDRSTDGSDVTIETNRRNSSTTIDVDANPRDGNGVNVDVERAE